ncbi:hypothetical protein [Arthrobacter sp. ISL-65]|uniref:sunset domain-containing protein n=1 Tax=Arthrobacter sp. ISL-65 TaxID=2819112 RepID=UPI002034CD58|nr:hypothetical protein [Arthrobacter sp. ISL-65]
MEWIIWVIVIVLIIAIVWWLLNRNSRGTAADATRTEQVTPRAGASPAASTGTEETPSAVSAAAAAGPPSATTRTVPETGRLAEPDAGPAVAEAAPLVGRPAPASTRPDPEDVEPDVESWEAATARPSSARSAGGDVDDWDDDGDKAEWDAQWSDAGSAAADSSTRPAAQEPAGPTHHAEYTDAHAPTLPGAESAAAESMDAEAETRQRIQSSAATEAGASHDAQPHHREPQPHHLEQGFGAERGFGEQPIHRERVADVSAAVAGEQPYGEGSALPAADGSAPDGYAVKGDVSAMTYYDDDSAGYEDARAEVWFLSPAHAEAAGFRAPRRSRR